MKLAYTEVSGAAATKTAFVLHGILGSGKNWRAFARRLADELPSWRFVLVDLRNHGESHPAPPPHTIEACARDLAELATQVGRPDAVIGHSFGGKVALAYGREVDPGAQLCAVDAVPFAVEADQLDDEVLAVLAMVERLPMPVSGHAEVQRAFLDAGFGEMIAGWMTTNLRREADGLHWRLHVPAMREMLRSYANEDLGPWLAEGAADVLLVRAGRSQRWTPAVLARLAGMGHVRVELVPDAGHWVHVEAPDALAGLLAAWLR